MNYQMTLFDLQQEQKQIDKYIRAISYNEVKPFVLNVHYARRMPSISHAFGLFVGGVLIGIVTYGIPASNFLCMGIAGKENKKNVLELNRLVLLPEYNGKNHASYLISHSLKMLPNRTYVVSYADTAWSHVGYVYQATNFLYTGLTAKRTDAFCPAGAHPRHYGQYDNEGMRQTRSQKHRYIYLVGDKRTKKQMRKELLYPVLPYPKGNEQHYDIHDPNAVNPIAIYPIRGKDHD